MARALLLLLLGLSAAAVQAQVCQTYVVQDSDTVISIAQNTGTTPQALEAALQNCDLLSDYQPGVTLLQISQRICLPGWVSQCQSVRSAGDNPDCQYYIVQTGDTMETISQYFSIPRQEIEAVNPDVNPATIAVNSFVRLPPYGGECPAPGNNQQCRVYQAQSGDSLSLIATAFSIPLAELQAQNSDVNGGVDGAAVLQPGQRIELPPFPDTCGTGVTVQKPSNCRAYIVQPGDTLFSIAAKFQTTSTELVNVNPSAAAGVLAPNTQIFLPPYDPNTCTNPEIVTGTPAPPSPPSPPPLPPSPPSPPPPSPVLESPPPVEAPTGTPAPVEAPAEGPMAETPMPMPAVGPMPEVEAEPPTAPPPVEAPPSGAASLASTALVAVLAVAGAALLF